jgi:tetratricopeptide (TPR) repeat protein
MPDKPSLPLPGDSQRQADATLLAFHFQLWHTVLAWLRLGAGDRLWIEQAEDFDVTSAEMATAVQVSHSLRRVTLRDEKVREAIFNCWRLQQQVGGQSIQFRYLTRGEAAVEAGDPFGAGNSGLKVWSAAASDPDVATRLLDFLRKERAHFPASFGQYLEQASVTDAIGSLFRPLIFELGSGDTSVVQDAVNVQLAAFAEQEGIMPAAAIKARDALFQRVASTAGQPANRWLTRAHLHATLAASAAVVVRPEFEAFMRTATELEPSLRALAAMATGSDTFIESPLPPPQDYIPRTEVVGALRAKLRPNRIIFIQASTGMGKTTLAKALAAAEPDVWQWVSMAGLRGEAVVQRLRALAARLARETRTPHVILDDVDVSSSARAGLSQAFAVLAVLLTQRNGQMLATTQTAPSPRVTDVCGDAPDLVFSLPRMGYQEIREMARLMGCPQGDMQEGWGRVARVRSQGHPQLARAVLLNAKSRGWPQPSFLDQAADESIGHVRAEARRLVSSLAESEKELLLRLSLITGRFRREHALALGAEPPPLPRPGEAFDPLLGAWIESMAANSFRVSPLLVDAADDVFADERVRDLHIKIARAFAQHFMSPQEGAQAFEHAWEARHVPALGGLVTSLFEQPRELFEAMSSHLAWFVIEGSTEGEVLLPDDPHASLLLRMFQARIAAERVPAMASRLLRAWRTEIEQSQPPAARPSARYLLAIQALAYGEIPLSATETVEYLGMLFELEAEDPQLRVMANEQLGNLPPEIAHELRHDSLAGLQAVLSFNRCRSVAWLDEWITAIENAPPPLRDKILHAARLNSWWCAMMVDAAWLDEEAKNQPDWTRCLAVLERMKGFAEQRTLPSLAFASVRATTVIRDEYQHDPATALRELDAFLATTETRYPRLLDARAAVLFHLEDYPAAVATWDEVLATWQPETGHDRYPAFAARTRAIALARMGDLKGAARGFTDARSRIPAGDDTPQVAGLLADAGLCWWKAGEHLPAFVSLREAAEAADSLPSGYTDLLAFRMRRMVSHVVTVLHNPLSGWAIKGEVELPPGAASDLTAPDALRELPEGPFEYTWVMLDRVANLLGLDERIPSSIQTKLDQSSFSATRFLMLETEIERAFRLGKLETLPALAERIEREFVAGLQQMRERLAAQQGGESLPVTGWQRESDMAGEKLFSAALVAACVHSSSQQVVSSWRNHPVARRWGDSFSAWLDHAEELLALSPVDAAARIRDPERLSSTDGLLLAARVASDDKAAPPDSLRSQAQLILALAHGFWRPALGHALVHLCEVAWLRHVKHPALLRDPRLTIPAIIDACGSSLRGIAKAAAIVLAASGATSLRIGAEMRGKLQRLAAYELPVFEAESPFQPPSSPQG